MSNMKYLDLEGERLKLTEGEFAVVRHIARIGRRRYKTEREKENRMREW